MPGMQTHAGIFKAYDIRGVVPATLDARLAQALGRAFAARVRRSSEPVVALGRDGRLSGPELAGAVMAGLLDGGVDVIDLGEVTTPMVSFAASTVCRHSIQVTASHNPRDHNGFKMVLDGRSVHGAQIQSLRESIEREEGETAAEPGRVQPLDIFPGYRDRIAGEIRLARPMRVVLDCGNGVAGASAPQVLRAIGCDVIELFTDVDGRFPNHHPEPGRPENLQDLVVAVKRNGAELGLALDGDGDRLGVVTRSGQIVFPDRQLMLFARDVLARQPGAPVLYDVKSTQRLGEAIAQAGGRPVMCPSGYALLKARMNELDAPLAGELSGHIFFRDRWYGFDDATYAAARLLEILARHDDASAVLEALPSSVSTPELHVACSEGESHRLAADLAAQAAGAPRFAGAEVCTLDGLRVDWPDGFGLVRASNTTPVLTLRFEGHTPEAMSRIQAEMLALLRSVKPDARIGGAAH
jgi:phosphomannomutase